MDNGKPVAVFVSNLRTLNDMKALFPSEWHERVQKARDAEGFICSPPFDILGKGIGYLVLMLRSGEEVMKDPDGARRITYEMTRFAEETLHADTIGLGSLTTSITTGGTKVRDLIDRNGWNVRATHGDTGTVAMLAQCIGKVIPAGTKPTVAVIGAYGVIGACISHVLASNGFDLMLHGRKPAELAQLQTSVNKTASRGCVLSLSTDLRDAVSRAEVIVTVTSHPTSLLTPDMLNPGTIVIDPAVPANTKRDPGYVAKGITVVSNACQVRVPGVAVTSAMFGTYEDPDGTQTTYACMAETWLDAMYGERRHLVGTVDSADVTGMLPRFANQGFEHAVPRMFGTPVPMP